ncbi:MAG: 50S ribosomal protein L17 [Candidatus Gastranaerophilales bacterium]|nr:50S ribosomal protein L17 [Candidatus Gastranaerophilales bacterium]
MRHQCKRHKLGRPADQRKAVLRSLASSLFMYGEITTTMAKAKALKPYAEKIISLAKRGDVHARRQAGALIFDQNTGRFLNLESGKVFASKEEAGEAKVVEETILRKLFSEIAQISENRNGGYTRILRMPPRRGDASEMALIQLV